MNEGLAWVWLAVFLTGLALIVIVGFFLLPFVAAGVGIIVFVQYAIHSKYHSPQAQERRAREKTELLYDEAVKFAPPRKEEFLAQFSNWRVRRCAEELYDLEDFRPLDPMPPVCNSIEGARYRDRLHAYMASAYKEDIAERFTESILTAFAQLPENEEDGLTFRADVPITPEQLELFCTAFFQHDDLFSALRATLNENVEEAGGLPTEYKGDDLKLDYLKNTPLLDGINVARIVAIPDELRFTHCHIIGATGSGKTQLMQQMLCYDIEGMLEGRNSVVVIDSQGEMIRKLANLDIDRYRLVHIEPGDIDHPPALNLFDPKLDRINSYDKRQREQLLNGVIELYDFVLASLLDAEMTRKQSTAFRFVTRLMLHIPDATVHTLLEIFSPNGLEPYRQYLPNLSQTAQKFFREEFDSREFNDTKRQVTRRLYDILESETFERMFSHPKTKLDLFTEMNEPKLILIDTDKELLKSQGSQLLGRFFIALIAQAAQERASLTNRLPSFVYIDEAGEYFNRSVTTILESARKYRVGLTLAHQSLSQMEPDVAASVHTNTAIKFAGGVSVSDANAMAREMRCKSEMIIATKPLSFVMSAKRPAVTVYVEAGMLEKLPKRDDYDEMRALMRERYSSRPKEEEEAGERPAEIEEPETPETPPEPEPEDETAPVDWQPRKPEN